MLAAPPSVVAALVSFNPQLPSERTKFMAATPTWAGDWTKIVAVFRRPFWRDAGLSGVASCQEGPVSCWWEAAAAAADDVGQSWSLGGFAFGDDAVRFSKQNIDIGELQQISLGSASTKTFKIINIRS